MRTNPVYPFGLALAIVALCIHLYQKHILWLGFPDGFICEVDGAEMLLAQYFISISLIVACWVAYLGIRSFRAEIRSRFAATCICCL